ncbi:restriction endonuclease [Kutzneria albida]|uniref:restriction endonuclease n=1 Tax=Kutzneria albida TaxID=43357 RepID=UPI00308404D9
MHTPLVSQRIDIRSKAAQLPDTPVGHQIIAEIHSHFEQDPVRFEHFAVDLWKLMAPSTGEVTVTRASRDGGRDAVGAYLLGPLADRLAVEFALEAKCYGPTNSVWVREMSRLISRLRYRQFGVFVTTSYFNAQVYKEVREDQHPVALVCARDIVEVLAASGVTTAAAMRQHLAARYPN